MIVDGGNAPVFERITAKIATAAVNGTPKDQSLSPLEVSRQGGCEGLRYHLTRLLSWLYAPRTPKRAGERDQGESTRCMYPAPSNLHSLIVLPLNLFERHPSIRGEWISTHLHPNGRRVTPVVETSLCFRRRENLLGKDLWLLGHGARSERSGL